MVVLVDQLSWPSPHVGPPAVHIREIQLRYVCAGYEEFAGKLIGALQDAIEADLSDMEERQVSSCPYIIA